MAEASSAPQDPNGAGAKVSTQMPDDGQELDIEIVRDLDVDAQADDVQGGCLMTTQK